MQAEIDKAALERQLTAVWKGGMRERLCDVRAQCENTNTHFATDSKLFKNFASIRTGQVAHHRPLDTD